MHWSLESEPAGVRRVQNRTVMAGRLGYE